VGVKVIDNDGVPFDLASVDLGGRRIIKKKMFILVVFHDFGVDVVFCLSLGWFNDLDNVGAFLAKIPVSGINCYRFL